MGVSDKVFNISGAIDEQGKPVCKETLAKVIFEIVKKLGKYSIRDFSDISLADISEIQKPNLKDDKIDIFFRVGTIYCEIKALFNKEEMLLNETRFGVRY